MANIDKKGNNRFTNAASSEETINKIDNNDVVLRILKDEFPDDIYYSRDKLTESPAKQIREGFLSPEQKRKLEKLTPVVRNSKNVADVSTEEDEYVRYDLAKSFPSIDEDELDEIIDEEWEYFEDPEDEVDLEDAVVEPGASGLFIVNSETDLRDFHDLYISAGPQNIDPEDEDITSRVFCVFFVQDGVAYAIPTYKTLEVMLVERGLTYDIITEATPDEIKDYDLLLDGELDSNIDYDSAELEDDDDGEVTPYQEFQQRSYPVRDSDWDEMIRFRSGYRPKAPFLRDPGDYIKPESVRDIEGRNPVDEDGNPLPPDRYVKEDPDDRYFDQVFQKQTYREKLREKYEGKMIIADWPYPEYDSDDVTQETEIKSDDAVLNLRMMINGHWKFVRSGDVMKLYAYLNDYDIAAYSPINAGRYGTTGYLQLLIEAGGIKVVQPAGSDEDEDNPTGNNAALRGDNDLQKKREPLWNAFPHIVDADDDGIKGVDRAEYQEYLDNFSNGGEPFMIDHLIPFEPPGSIKYYPKEQYQDLIQQALAQEQIDSIKEQIYEVWPGIAALIENTKIAYDALPANYMDYVTSRLGAKGPLYKIWISKEGKWKYVKRKGRKKKKRVKTKKSNNRLFRICSKTYRIKINLNKRQERDLVKKYKWMKTVKRDKFAAWMSGGAAAGVAGAPVAVGAGLAINQSMIIAANTALAAAKAAADAAFVAQLVASGQLAASMAGGVAITGAAPTFGSILIGAATNPITIGAAALVGAFFLADAIIGEVPADKYDLPPWRFMDDNWYLKACIYNEVDGHVEGFKMAADAADTALPWISGVVNDLYDSMGTIDKMLLNAMEVDEFQAILDMMLATQSLCDELQSSGLYAQASSLKSEVDLYLRDQLKRQYNAVQYLRKKVHKKIGRKKKFGIVWPKGPQKILNKYVPGCKFDNYQPGGA